MNGSSVLAHAIQELLDGLGALADEYDEFTDSEVREAVHLALTRHFVWGAGEPLPVTFRMRSVEGDAQIQIILRTFLRETSDEVAPIPVGQLRLMLLQNPDLPTANGMRYDELFGHRDEPLPLTPLPADMLISPRYDT